MTAFAINTGGIVDWDSLSGGSTGATLDSYAVSAGSTLRIDCDSFHCLNHSEAFGSLDTVTFADIGGTVLADTTGVRVIPYDTGNGNVPAIGTSISQGGVSAELLGVWDNWQSEPTAAGAAMPVNGYIKVKDKAGGNFAAGALTGIGASATGADVQGWIEIRLADTGTCSLPRRGAFQVTGGLFELGTTSGVRGQVLECPTTATHAGVFPGVLVEVTAGGALEWYPSVGSLAADANIGTEAERGKVCWQTTAGIRLASDGTNNVGYLPAAGLKVFIPSVIFTACTRSAGGSGPRVVPNATLGTRWEFSVDQGSVDIEGAVFQGYANFDLVGALTLTRFAANDVLRISNPFAAPVGSFVCVAPTQVQSVNALFLNGSFNGSTFTDSKFFRATLPNVQYVAGLEQTKDAVFTRCTLATLGFRSGGASYAMRFVDGAQGLTLTDCTVIGGKFFGNADSITFTDTTYIDRFSGFTDSSQGLQIWEIPNCSNCKIDGVNFPFPGSEVYFAVVRLGKTNNTFKLRNVATFAARADFNLITEKLIEFNGYGDDIRIQRCFYFDNRAGGRVWTDNGANTRYTNVIIENCFGDYADDGRPFANLISRGNAKSTATNQIGAPGCHFRDEFRSDTTGVIELRFNPPSAATAPYIVKTAGNPLHGSADVTFFPVVGDQLTCEMSWSALGYTATANLAPTLAGTNTANLDLTFDVDTGSGFSGTFTALTQANWFAVGAIDPAVGIKVKVRVTANASDNTNALHRLDLPLVTTTTAQQNFYPLDVATVSVSSLTTGSRVKLIRNDTSAIIDTATESAGAVSFETDFLGSVTVVARNASGSPYYKEWSAVGTLTADGLSFVAQQVLDE